MSREKTNIGAGSRDSLFAAMPQPLLSGGVRLSDALAAGALMTWSEAVAATRAVAALVDDVGPGSVVPALADVLLLPTGQVRADGGRAHQQPVVSLASLLKELLQRAGPPPQLLDLQRRALTTPEQFPSIADFGQALGFFARPDGPLELARYFDRAVHALANPEREAALEALQKKAASGPVGEPDHRSKANIRKRLLVGAACLAGALFGLAGWAYYDTMWVWLNGPGRRAVVNAAGSIGSAAERATSSLRGAVTGAVRDLPAAVPPPPTAPAPRASTGSPRPLARPLASVSAPREAVPLATTTRAEAPVPSAAAAAIDPAMPAPQPPRPDDRVYSEADTTVQPPELIRPQLPREQPGGLSSETPGSLELLVLEDGTVGAARLVPASNRLQDRMLISAAKAWQFRPAERDGMPVRYRIRIRITW